MEDIPPSSTVMTCDTAGVISPAPFVIGSLQTVEALKILVGSEEIEKDWAVVDVWAGTFERLQYCPSPDCPACQGQYDFLKGKFHYSMFHTSRMLYHKALEIFFPIP